METENSAKVETTDMTQEPAAPKPLSKSSATTARKTAARKAKQAAVPVAKAKPVKASVKSAAEPVAKQEAKPTAKANAKVAAQLASNQEEKLAVKTPAKTAAKPKVEKVAKEVKPAKKAKLKVVRDSFTMPQNEYNNIADIKEVCLKAGFPVKKSEVLRAGLKALCAMDGVELKNVLLSLEKIKTGRPNKH